MRVAHIAGAFALVLAGCKHGESAKRSADLVEEVVARALKGDFLERFRGLDAKAQCDAVYERLYERDSSARSADPSGDADYLAALKSYERSKVLPEWYVRVGQAGQAGEGDLVRLYLNLRPSEAVAFTQAVTLAFNVRSIPFTLKLPVSLAGYGKSSAGVVYVLRPQYSAARAALLSVLEAHPNALAPEVPAFTKHLAPGVGVADEPAAAPAPATRPKHSFGTFMADALCEVLREWAKPAPPEQVATRLRERLRRYQVDPARPWLKQRKDLDDL